jgi:hypothetical protein
MAENEAGYMKDYIIISGIGDIDVVCRCVASGRGVLAAQGAYRARWAERRAARAG